MLASCGVYVRYADVYQAAVAKASIGSTYIAVFWLRATIDKGGGGG